MHSTVQRMIGAARLDAAIYEEIESDRGATGQAFLVVLFASAAAGVGAIENHAASGILWHTIHGLILWYVWAYITYWIGTRLLPSAETSADHGELLRTIGFSSAPGLLRALGLITPIAGEVFVICTLWMLVAMVIAVRQALDYESTWRAIGVCAIGWVVPAVILGIAVSMVAPAAG